jgi:hypothetical protein
MSKFGRLNLQAHRGMTASIDDLDSIIADIKSLTTRPLGRRKKPSAQPSISLSQSRSHASAKVRARYLPRKKPVRPAPHVRRVYRPDQSMNVVPGATQYTPNYLVGQIQAPKIRFGVDPRETNREAKVIGSVVMRAEDCTRSQMVVAWQHYLRVIRFLPEQKAPASGQTQPEPISASKPHVRASSRDSYIPQKTVPSPDHYHLARSLDKHRVIAFNRQSTRPEVPTVPDRSHERIGEGIDSTKPRIVCPIPFRKQPGREPAPSNKGEVWAEIEAEQKHLLDTLRPPEPPAPAQPKLRESFALQSGSFDTHPFAPFFGPECTRNLHYDVEETLAATNTQIQPRTHFGRRLEDSSRTVYAITDAPDVLFSGVREEWAQSHPGPQVPLLQLAPERKSPYFYMPRPCGKGMRGLDPNEFWNEPTPVVMSRMGERTTQIDLLPQYQRARSALR